MDEIKCLYFDDQIDDPTDPLGAFLFLLENNLQKKKNILIKKVSERKIAEKEMEDFRYALIFLDIRINPQKGGGMENYRWERTGIGMIENIRNGVYEEKKSGTSTPKDVPIIVITAVADTQAQEKINRIGGGENNQYKLALFEKPVSADDVASKVFEFLDFD